MTSALPPTLRDHTPTYLILDTYPMTNQYINGDSSDDLMNSEIIRTPEDIKHNRIFHKVDGIKFLTHEGGCVGFRLDSETLTNLFAGYVTNPNVAGATILSLGCQNAEVKNVLEGINQRDPNFSKPLYVLEQQKSKSEYFRIEPWDLYFENRNRSRAGNAKTDC